MTLNERALDQATDAALLCYNDYTTFRRAANWRSHLQTIISEAIATYLSALSMHSAHAAGVAAGVLETACELARDHLEIDYDGDQHFIRSDSIERAVEAILSLPASGVEANAELPVVDYEAAFRAGFDFGEAAGKFDDDNAEDAWRRYTLAISLPASPTKGGGNNG